LKSIKPTIIAIAGPSASGKTLFAQTIHDELIDELGEDGISIIFEDAYYRDQSHLSMQEREQTNYDHPNAFEHDLLSMHLLKLTKNETIQSPVYCYKTHTRLNETKLFSPTRIILVEGILLLSNKELRDRFDIKVYMDTPLDICLIRRIKRDLVERNRSVESVITRGGKNRMAIEVLKAKIRQLSQPTPQQ
jgi:uridine kinase